MADRMCSIEGCEQAVYGHGWCSKHYTRWRRHGDPEFRIAGEVRDGKKICSQCGVDKPVGEFGRKHDSWCRGCYAQRQRERRAADPPQYGTPVEATCRVCGVSFVGNLKNNTFCSEECRAEGKKRFDSEWAQRHPDRARAAKRRYRQSHPEVHADKEARRRARKRVGIVEDVKREVVFERDGEICQLCGEPIDLDLSHPDPRSASIDHVIPLAHGGAHTYENCQAAHLICNILKSDRLEVSHAS